MILEDFSDNQKIVKAFQHWFAMAEDSTQEVLTKLWLEQDPDLRRIYDITQEHYKECGIDRVHLYRACTETKGYEKVLCSWTDDRKLAESYLTDVVRERVTSLGIILEQEFPVEQVLFDMNFAPFYFDEIDDALGMMPCPEHIIINNLQL